LCRTEWSNGTQFLVGGFRFTRKEWSHVCRVFLEDETIERVKEGCKISYVTSWKAIHLLRTAMTEDIPQIFSGICEADETYIGGAWRNKNIHIRRQHSKRGRGIQKQEVFGVVSRHRGQVRVWLVPDSKQRTLFPLIRLQVEKDSTIFTDGFNTYRRLPRFDYIHEWVDHDAGEYVRGIVHTQTIDGFWGLMKTHLDSIGGIRKSHSHLFVGESVWRYNFRHLTRQERVERPLLLLSKIGGRN
jgi:transposase-like protein